ncbi:glycosyl transferase [Pseudomonas sp. SDO55104_S430]
MRLVYLSPVPWASFAQRPQKFVRWFHEKTSGEVLWLEPYPSRFPCLADFSKIGVSDKTETDPHEPWLTVLKPKALPIEPFPASGLINGRLYWSELLDTVTQFAKCQETLLVIGKPTVLALQVLKRLEKCDAVYDAMDDFPTFFSGLSRSAMARRELAIGRKVKTILASSTRLRQKWEQHSANVRLVPNGLDTALLPSTRLQISSNAPKIFGYLGTVGAWFDWQWVIRFAQSRPDDLIHIVGPIFKPYTSKLPTNIKVFPPCSHKDALVRMLSFDVAIIPFVKNELTASVDPIKYYEYKALGLPVISTRFGEMFYRGHEEGIFLCDTQIEVREAIGNALKYQMTLARAEEFKAASSWRTRFDASDLI